MDVKLSFGSDTHNLYEVGEFAPHLHLLREIGFDGDPQGHFVDWTLTWNERHV